MIRGKSPLGGRISADSGKTWLEVVGVVGDVRHYGLDTDPADEVESIILSEAVERALTQLDDVERRALELRFGLGDEEPTVMPRISEELDLPEHRVRQVITEAVRRLAELLEEVEELRVA